MITIKLNIKILSDSDYIVSKQHNYSYAFRKLYNNIHLIKNADYLFNIKTRFNLTDIELRSLVSEVNTKFKQIAASKSKLESDIILLDKEILELKSLPKSNKNTRKLIKLKNRLDYKNNLLSKDIVFGGKHNLIKLGYLNNNKTINENKIIEVKKEYTENRLLSIFIIGEANQNGNRFFLFDLLNNKVTYKPNRKTKIDIEFSKYKSYTKILSKLQDQINSKLISVSVRLSKHYFYLIFDDEILNGYGLNVNERANEVKIIKQNHIDDNCKKKLIKQVYRESYKEQEERKLNNKLSYRYLAIDTNPDYIGCCILDKIGTETKIVNTFYYDLTKLNSIKTNNNYLNNKRKHGICHIWKDIFKTVKYYNCAYIVIEDLNIKNKDLGNKQSNRKINNIWYRELSSNLIDKYCNKMGLIKILINPCYSSFIGNVLHDYVDPVNASIEIGRRGIYKFIKDKFYPKLEVGTIMDAMSKLNKLRDVSFIKDHENWVKLYRKVHQSGLRYRATMDDVLHRYRVVNNIVHSNIKKICFLKENRISLHINS